MTRLSNLASSQTVQPQGGYSKRPSPPAIDQYGLPLPRRVDEIDMNATRVTPAAYHAADPAFLERTFAALPPGGIHSFFDGLGLLSVASA